MTEEEYILMVDYERIIMVTEILQRLIKPNISTSEALKLLYEQRDILSDKITERMYPNG